MDIMLERILSLIPRKTDGKYVHGAKKEFCERIGAPVNIISEWESGKTKSYRNYLYQIASEYGVSVEWLKGETDETKKDPYAMTGEEVDEELFDLAKELQENYDLRRLLHAARGTDADNVRRVADMLEGFRKGRED